MPAVGGLLLVLAGCAGGPGISSEPVLLPADAARVATVPPAPPVTGVVETRSGRTVTQKIMLRTAAPVPGENAIEVTIRPGKATLPDAAVLGAQMAAAAPMALAPSGRVVRNAYGPFGYAYGRRGGIGCIYAWQALPGAPRTFGSEAIDIRVRICAPGAGENRLVAMAAAITVSAAGATPAPVYGVPAAGGSYGTPVYGTPVYGAPAGGAVYAGDDTPAPRHRTVYRAPAAPAYTRPAAAMTATPVSPAATAPGGQAAAPAARPDNVRPTGPLGIDPPLGMPTTLQGDSQKTAAKRIVVPVPPAPPAAGPAESGPATGTQGGTAVVPAP